jgi:outer membrane protein
MAILPAAGAAPLAAGAATSTPAKHDQTIGGGIYVVPQPYEGVGISIVPTPLFNVSYRRFYIYGTEGGFRWNERSLLGWRVFVTPRFMGYNAKDSDALKGMESRSYSGDFGAGVTVRPIPFIVDLKVRSDILGKSGGQDATLDVDLLLPAGGWLLRPSAGLQWQSGDLADYYYGVRRSEARPGRPADRIGAALNPYVEIEVSRKIGERWTFAAGLTVTRLDREIADSPIVSSNDSKSGYIGLLYDF